MNTSLDERDPVELLAEEFLDRKRRGEKPTLGEYLDRHPDLGDAIQDLFPALLMMEELGADSGGTTGSLVPVNGAAFGIRPERLGDYRILREIGRGGMGVVYEAEQESLGRRVALKVLAGNAFLDTNRVRRFEREAKAAARLHHTNIVPVFGVGSQDGHHYFVMQFIAGLGLDLVLEDLRRLRGAQAGDEVTAASVTSRPVSGSVSAVDVARSLLSGRFEAGEASPNGSVTEAVVDAGSPAPPVAMDRDSGSSPSALPGSSGLSSSSDPDRQYYRSVARIGIQVADALEYANRQGILHRDVKPANLLLDNHGNVWVADFGLAKTAEADDLTQTGDILGTIRYMAPERFSGKCDARSDVYSLGLTLYELVSLRPAFEASDRHALMDCVLHGEAERLKKRVPGVPRDLETIIAKAMARDAGLRYPTAAALAEDLRRFVEDRPIRARRVSAAEQFTRWCRRNPVIAGSVGVAATALMAMVVLALAYANRQARHASEQARANVQIRQLASDLEKESGTLKAERGRLEVALSESNSRLARLDLERGRVALEKGQIGVGLLWTVESLRMATRAADESGKRLALANLSAWRRQMVELKQVISHADAVRSVAFSPDGKAILTGSDEHTARIWDTATGKAVGQPMRHTDLVRSVQFSPDGRRVLTASNDGTARQWNRATGQPIGPALQHSGFVFAAAYSPDGKTIVTACLDKTARLWDAETGRPLGTPMRHGTLVFHVAYSPDGKLIATASWDNTARLWDAATGLQVGNSLSHPDSVYAVAFSPDSKIVVTGGRDKKARLWDVTNGQPIGPPMDHSGSVSALAFSPDGRSMVTGCSDNVAYLWDVATSQRLKMSLEHQGMVQCVAFSPDGRSILTGSSDMTARLWDGRVEQPVGRVIEFGTTALACSADAKTIATFEQGGLVGLWDVSTGRRLDQTIAVGSATYAAAFSPDGKLIATDSRDRLRLWDVGTGRLVGKPLVHPETLFGSIAFSANGKLVALGCDDRSVRIWNVADGSVVGIPLEHPKRVTSLAFRSDGKVIVTGCMDKKARTWETATGRPIGEAMAHSDWVNAVVYSPDGKMILTGSRDKTARLWDAETGRPIGSPMVHPNTVVSVAFSPDGRMIVARPGGELRLWDTATGQPVGPPLACPLGSSQYPMTTSLFSPDGRLLVACDWDAVRVWQVPAPVPDELPRLTAWLEAATGIELDNSGSIRALDHSAWGQRRQRLGELGGEPLSDQPPRFDPLLFVSEPTVRGDAWRERGQWDRAAAAYVEAARVRPLTSATWRSMARFYIERGQYDLARAALCDAVRMMPNSMAHRFDLSIFLQWRGDQVAWRRANESVLERFGGTTEPFTARLVAGLCVQAADGAANMDALVRLAKLALEGNTVPSMKPSYLNTMGAALYRAGRFQEAIPFLDEAVSINGPTGQPLDAAYLAMAHERLGHHAEALRWLEYLRGHQASAEPALFWNELQVQYHLIEAEAVVVYDPVFPADVFAH